MRAWQRVGVAVVATITFTGVGVAWSQGITDSPVVDLSPVRQGPAPKDLGSGLTEAKVVPITPCRIVDTRKKGGPLARGVTRTFKVRGSGSAFAAQGGRADGCNISGAADAVEATVTAVTPSGPGYLRAWPAGQSEPDATFLNYGTTNIGNTGTLAVCNTYCPNGDLTVKANDNTTALVIDVVAYDVKPMGVQLDSEGDVVASSRVTSVVWGSGFGYEVLFDRNVETCVASATVANSTNLSPVVTGNSQNAVFVQTLDTATHALVQGGLTLILTC